MIAKLYLYFGIVGIASIGLWLGALILAINYAFHERRTFFFSRAVVLALAGILLAQINSCNIGHIQVDRRQEIREALERQRQAQQAELDTLKRRAANISFAEDNTVDALDLAGVSSFDNRSVYEKAADEKSGDEQRKQSGRKRWRPVGDAVTEQALDPDRILKAELESSGETTTPTGRLLPQRDVMRADQLDMLNRWASRLVLGLVLLAFILNYFRYFNRTVDPLLPLPFSGRLIDSLFPKKHSVVLRGGKPGWPQHYLETVVRKGECFVYCGDTDIPLPSSMPRVYLPLDAMGRYFIEVIRPVFLLKWARRLGQISIVGQSLKSRLAWPRGMALARRIGITIWTKIRILLHVLGIPFRWLWKKISSMNCLRRLTGKLWNSISKILHWITEKFRNWRNSIFEFYQVRIIDTTAQPRLAGPHFICECAWFDRYCFTTRGLDQSLALVSAFRRFISERIPPRASAAKTIHLLWNLREPPDPKLLHPLAVFSKEVNVKLVILAGDSQIAAISPWVEEICPDEVPPLNRPTLIAWLTARIRHLAGTIQSNLQPRLNTYRANKKIRREKTQAKRMAQAAKTSARTVKPEPAVKISSATPAVKISRGKEAKPKPAPVKPPEPAKPSTPDIQIPKAKVKIKASKPVMAPAPKPAAIPKPVTETKAEPPVPTPSPVAPPAPIPESPVAPRIKSAQPISADTAKSQPRMGPSVKPVTKTPPDDFQEIKVKPPEILSHVTLEPKVKKDISRVESAKTPETKVTPPAPTPPKKAPAPAEAAQAPAPIPAAPRAPAETEPKKQEPIPKALASSPQIAEINQAAGTFKFYCQACQQKLAAKMDWQGKTISCPVCRASITIPTL